MQAGHKSKPVRLLAGRSLSGTASKSVRTGHRAEFVRTRSGGRLFSVKIVIDAGFFRKNFYLRVTVNPLQHEIQENTPQTERRIAARFAEIRTLARSAPVLRRTDQGGRRDGRPDRHRHRRRQHLPRTHRRQEGLRPREGRPDGHAGHDHQLAGAAVGTGGQRREGQGTDFDPHGTHRRILLQGPCHRVPRSGLCGDYRRGAGGSLFHDRTRRRRCAASRSKPT